MNHEDSRPATSKNGLPKDRPDLEYSVTETVGSTGEPPISIMGVGVRRVKPAPRRPPCPLWGGPGQNYGVLLWMEAGF